MGEKGRERKRERQMQEGRYGKQQFRTAPMPDPPTPRPGAIRLQPTGGSTTNPQAFPGSKFATTPLGIATGFGVFRLTGKPGKTAGFQKRKTGFVRTQKTGFGGFNFGCQNCTEKRAETYCIGILEVKLIAIATQILTPSKVPSVKVHLGLVQTNIFGVICTMSYHMLLREGEREREHIVIFVQACLLLN